jgi:Cd2+/Zn2+-exporting ATPase
MVAMPPIAEWSFSMATEKLTLDLSLVLPEIPDARDACVARLTEILEAQQIESAHLVRENGARLCLHYDPAKLSIDRVRELVRVAGAQINDRYRHETLRVDGMDCETCATVIEHSLSRADGILEAAASYAAERLRVEYDAERTSGSAIVARLGALGFRVVEEEREPGWFAEHRELLLSLASGLLLLAGWLTGSFGGNPWVASGFLWAAYGAGGLLTTRNVWHGLRQRRIDIDALMLAAAVGAAVLGEWAEGALLLFLFSLGHALEHLAMGRARKAVRALAELAPKTALIERDGTELELPVENLERGDRVIVKPGQRIPADGKVIAGSSAVDQSPITGESMPVEVTGGNQVFTGSVNGDGTLTVEVTKLARESTLARVVELVKNAQTHKAPTQRFTERFVRVFVPAVLIGTGLLIAVPSALGLGFTDAFYRAMAVLVAASPCALAISTPATVLSAVARAARDGVLVKGGGALETLGLVRAMAFDKTGTLTRGQPEVVELVPMSVGETELLRTAASVERLSGHPLAQAVVRTAEARGLELGEATSLESVMGRGVRAVLDGALVEIGSTKLFDMLPEVVRAGAEGLQQAGRTVMIVSREGRFLGVIGLADTVRAETQETLEALRTLKVDHTVMLTGDNVRVATEIAKYLAIDEIRAELLPEQKKEVMEDLSKRFRYTAMVGDGVNDAPAMARASVGIAMGGAGTDVALETADVALMADDLSKLPFAVSLSRAGRRVIRQNLWLALGVVALLIPSALFDLAGIGSAVLVHEGSTLIVVANALRLLRYPASG